MIKNLLLSMITALLMLPLNAWGNAVSGRITMAFDLSSHSSQEATRLWIPYPVSNHNQTVTQVRVSGDYFEAAVYTESKHQTPMLYAHWKKGTSTRTLMLSFSVERQEVERRHLPTRQALWDPADYALFLAPTRLGPIDGEVKKLADQIVGNHRDVLSKAKAIYDWTCEHTYRDPATRGCGFGDVYRLLKEPGGKCADISSIFVALARAAGVPSREVFGIRQGNETVQDISTWQHCWAEFYLPGYGWVPVDPADVRKKMLKEDLSLDNEKTDAYRKYFWGGIDAYRVMLGHGRDLHLNPPQSGPPVNYLMYPFAQIGEETLDWLDPKTFKYTITYNRE